MYLEPNNPSLSFANFLDAAIRDKAEIKPFPYTLEVCLSEIAARVGSAPEQVAMALESIVEPASLYEPAYTDGDDTLAIMDRVQEASCEESWISDIMFKDTVQALTPRERRIIALRYLSGQTQVQVAQAIGISQAQVSRLEKCALNHIKEQISCR